MRLHLIYLLLFYFGIRTWKKHQIKQVPGFGKVDHTILYEAFLEPIVSMLTQVPGFGKVDHTILYEAFLEPTALLQLYGYPAEKHSITTKDGFVLTLHRIPNTSSNGIPILLVHGIGCASTQYFSSQYASPAFLLANSGFDVWMGNLRGGPYTSHIQYSRHNNPFWNFSWDEMAKFDLPAMIDYVLKISEKPKLLYGGQSMGTTVGFALLSSSKIYNEKVAGFLGITPVAFLNYTPSLIYKLVLPLSKFFKAPHGRFGDVSGLNLNLSMALYPTKTTTTLYPEVLSSVVAGFDPYLHNATRMPIYIAMCSYGSSTKTFLHMAQIHTHGKMRRFDYGTRKNRAVYDSDIPPEYNLNNITTPVVLFYGANDAISDPLDVELLSRSLPSLVSKELISWPLFSHLDSTTAMDGKELLYDKFVFYAKTLWEDK